MPEDLELWDRTRVAGGMESVDGSENNCVSQDLIFVTIPLAVLLGWVYFVFKVVHGVGTWTWGVRIGARGRRG